MDHRSYFLQILNKSVLLEVYERVFAHERERLRKGALLIFHESVYIVMSALSYVCGTGILGPYFRVVISGPTYGSIYANPEFEVWGSGV